MRKYYWTRIYQVDKHKGYLTPGEEYKTWTAFKSPDCEYKLEAVYTLVDNDDIIIVEKIFPFLAREIKTGIIFPIVNFKRNSFYKYAPEYISYPLGLVHTFVASREGELVAKEVEASSELEEYNKLHPKPKKFKEELLAIINRGKNNMNNKISQELDRKYQKIAKMKQEEEKVTEERHKTRNLRKQIARERKNI